MRRRSMTVSRDIRSAVAGSSACFGVFSQSLGGGRRRTVRCRQASLYLPAQCFHLGIRPGCLASQFQLQDPGYRRSGCEGRMTIQDQGRRAANQHVADSTHHFMPRCPVNFAAAVGQVGMQPLVSVLYFSYRGLHISPVRSVSLQDPLAIPGLLLSVQPKTSGYARAGSKPTDLNCRINGVLGHLAIGCPFSSRNRDQA